LFVLCLAACDSSSGSNHDDLSVADDLSVKDGAASDAGMVLTVDAGLTGVFTYNATDTAGAFQVVTIDHGKNTIKGANTTDSYGLAGTIETLASGYLKITFNAGCNGAGCTPSTSATSVSLPGGGTIPLPSSAHGIEAPGAFVMILGDDLRGGVLGVAASDCTTDMLGDYTTIDVVEPMGTNLFTDVAYVESTLAGTATAPTVTGSIFPLTADGGAFAGNTGTCSAGVISFSGNPNGDVNSLESGAAGVLLTRTPLANNNALLSIGIKHSSVTLADLESHSYSGYTIIIANGGGVEYTSLVFGASNAGAGHPFADPDANALDPDPSHGATITLDGIDGNGLISASISGAVTGVMRGAAIQAGGHNLLVLEGAPNGDGTQIINVVLVSR
jgi:hypothetical protein